MCGRGTVCLIRDLTRKAPDGHQCRGGCGGRLHGTCGEVEDPVTVINLLLVSRMPYGQGGCPRRVQSDGTAMIVRNPATRITAAVSLYYGYGLAVREDGCMRVWQPSGVNTANADCDFVQ